MTDTSRWKLQRWLCGQIRCKRSIGQGSTSNSDSHGTDFEVYKLVIEMADRTSARRAIANSFYLALHSALVAGLLVSTTERGPETSLRSILLVCAAIAGLFLAVLWRCSLGSYQRLNQAKYRVIGEIEKVALAPHARLYTNEWSILTEGTKQRPRYKELGRVERQVPLVFMFVYLAIGSGIMVSALT